MNKKQAGIILALLALIITAGVLAAKVNGPVGEVSGKDFAGNNKAASNDDKNASSNKQDFFFESRGIRDKRTAETLQTLNTVINNEKLSKQEKDEAIKNHTMVAMAHENETKIEIALKGKGFDDALCLIENDKARIFIKSKEQLTDKQRKQIQEVVMSVAKLKNVEIEIRQ